MSVVTLKVTLRHVQPPVWRRLRVPSSITLADVHDALQIAFGWEDRHLHQFRIGGELYGVVTREDRYTQSDTKVILETIVKATTRFVYAYDLGDDWEHDIVVEKIEDTGDDELVCVDGHGSRPPEDCGGPPGYESLVAVLADPKDPEHAAVKKWAGPRWDEEFNLELVNRQLRKLDARWRRRARPKTPQLRLVKPPKG